MKIDGEAPHLGVRLVLADDTVWTVDDSALQRRPDDEYGQTIWAVPVPAYLFDRVKAIHVDVLPAKTTVVLEMIWTPEA